MAAAVNNRFRIAIVLATLAICAFFAAQGATALLSARMLDKAPAQADRPSKPTAIPTHVRERHDPNVLLRRNIFDSALGDLTAIQAEASDLPETEMPDGKVESPCNNTMRLIGTVVVPGQLEQSLAAIVGSDSKAGLHRGGAEVDGSKIRSIQSDAVVLQTSTGFCRLAMFEVGSGPASSPPRPQRPRPAPQRAKRRGPEADRNAGLTDTEIAEGIEKVNDTNFNISRSMMNKVLDNAGKLIGIAAVRPKIENGGSVGMEIRGVRANTLLTKLGIQNGDVLESVNGQPLTSTDAALGAYTTLRTGDKFSLSIRRGDQSMIINYNLQ
jgi:type II secretory pathway component PulC